MKQITAYKSNDGKIFESSEEAREHERTKPIVDWLRANGLLRYLPDLISKDAIDFALALFVYHYGDISEFLNKERESTLESRSSSPFVDVG